jgi:hypothetical protein
MTDPEGGEDYWIQAAPDLYFGYFQTSNNNKDKDAAYLTEKQIWVDARDNIKFENARAGIIDAKNDHINQLNTNHAVKLQAKG